METYTMYKISCKDPSITEIYVGSTCNLVNRKRCHKSVCNNKNSKCYNLKIYDYIRKNGGWDNFEMTRISEFACDSKVEKLKEERRLVETLGATLNVNRPGRGLKEYREDNKEKVNKRQRELYAIKKLNLINLNIKLSKEKTYIYINKKMPKGITYQLIFKKSKTEFTIYNNLKMKDLLVKIRELYVDLFGIEIKIDNMTISNLMHRPENVNLLVKEFVSIKKIMTNPKLNI